MALLTDERGFITEGTGNNYFIVKDGECAATQIALPLSLLQWIVSHCPLICTCLLMGRRWQSETSWSFVAGSTRRRAMISCAA